MSDSATEAIGRWLADRWGYKVVPEACKKDAAELVEYLRARRIGFQDHDGQDMTTEKGTD